MGIFKHKPEISVCIPIFGTERYLEKCLESVGNQNCCGIKDFFEVVAVDDCSPGGCAEKIVEKFRKKYGIFVKFVRHDENKGLVEARRTAVFEARGKYIFHLDSDDFLPAGALKSLYQVAVETDADIVHGSADIFLSSNGFEENLCEKDSATLKKYMESRKATVRNVFLGELSGGEILDGYLTKGIFNGFLWGKLFKRDVCLEAFDRIPLIYNTMAEDFIQFVWIAAFSKKYVGIEDCVYNYSVNTGVSSGKKICELKDWERICSTASVFTALFSQLQESGELECGDCNVEIQEHIFSKNQVERIKLLCRKYLYNNIMQFHSVVDDCIKDEAHELLCDYWGEDFVRSIENIYEEDEKKSEK